MIKKFTSLLLASLLLSVIAVTVLPKISEIDEAEASENICQTPVTIVQPAQTTVLSNVVLIELAGNAGISSVKYELNGNIIGRASVDPTSGSQWRMGWDTRFTQPANNKALTARVKYIDGQECVTNPVIVSIFNPSQLNLAAVMTPPEWSGTTNSVVLTSIDFQVPNTTTNIAKYAHIVWSVSGRGSISPEPLGKARYYSGPEGGNGTVKAQVYYGGQNIQLQMATTVFSQNTSGSGGTPTSSGGSEPTSAGGDDTSTSGGTSNVVSNSTDSTINSIPDSSPETEKTIEEPKDAITRIVTADDFTKSCLISKLGEDVFNRLVEENRRPRSGEFQAYLSCFARQNYVLPSVLAPVAPTEVVSKKESKRVQIRQIKNNKKIRPDDNTEKTVLELSGSTDPNVTVLLYVFSEPLVLATTSDDEGNWTYSLEDPLENGQHEVYALVDRGDGEYERSSVASFFIGTAEATSENPNGYSLELLTEPTVAASNRSVNMFIAATVGIVTFIGTILLIYGFRKLLPARNDMNASISIESPTDEHEKFNNFTKGL